MLRRLKNSFVFRLEQTLVRGPLWRFAVLLVLVALVTLLAGLLIRQLVPGFESLGDALWWAFEHIIVPEYVDDDEGIAKLTVGTGLIVFGSILFAGAVIAILVQWLDDTIERLELGLTPVALNAHIVLAGWNSRSPIVLQEILLSQGRIERFLRRRGARRLYVAVLAERADAALREQIKLHLGTSWNARQIILRSGSYLRLEDLQRVDFAHAGAVVVPADDTTAISRLNADTRAVKTLMTIGAALELDPPEELPVIVAEIQQARHVDTLRGVYSGPMEVISGDELIGRLVVQVVRYPGISHVFEELLSDQIGSQIYVREEPDLIGQTFLQLAYAFPAGVLLGIVRPEGIEFQALLNPPDDLRIEPGDRIAVLAPSHKDAMPPEIPAAVVEQKERPPPEVRMPARRRVLMLGWNHKIPEILHEFASYPDEEFEIDIVSTVATEKRESQIAVEGLAMDAMKIRHIELDYAVPALHRSLDPDRYDNVVLLASDRLKPGAESDARAIMAYVLLNELARAKSTRLPVLVELTDPDNVALFENRHAEVIVSTTIISRMLARVALRRELHAVFRVLFGSGGSEILFRPISDYGLLPDAQPGADAAQMDDGLTFADVQRAADARREIAIGIRRTDRKGPQGGVQLNPRRDQRLGLTEGDEVIVLTTYR